MSISKGDIVYFKKTYTALYCKKGGGGTYEYKFNVGDKYEVIRVIGTSLVISNGDGVNHFAHGNILKSLSTKVEWRNIQINNIIYED